jgi:hypothetical protein
VPEASARQSEHVLDADVPVGIVGRELAQPEVRELLHRREPTRVFEGAAKRDDGTPALLGRRQVNGHEASESMAVVRLDHQVREAPRERVDDGVGELAERSVGAANGRAEFHFHGLAPFLESERIVRGRILCAAPIRAPLLSRPARGRSRCRGTRLAHRAPLPSGTRPAGRGHPLAAGIVAWRSL